MIVDVPVGQGYPSLFASSTSSHTALISQIQLFANVLGKICETLRGSFFADRYSLDKSRGLNTSFDDMMKFDGEG